MSTAEQWAGALAAAGSGSFSLRFDRLGLDARCRPLSAGEVEECLRMGGERGLRYALYLACDDLREAGESLKKQGAVATAFDITEKLSYGDVLAAGAAVLGQSGTDTAAVSLEGGDSAAQKAGMTLAERMVEGESTLSRAVGDAGSYGGYVSTPEEPFAQGGASGRNDPWELADRLWAAWGNR